VDHPGPRQTVTQTSFPFRLDDPPTDARAALAGALDRAWLLAGAGLDKAARELCAAAVFHHQPLLVQDRALLRRACAVLIRARGFSLLGRLTRLTLGLDIQVRLASDPVAALPALSRQQQPEVMVYTIDPTRLIADTALIRRWSEELVPDPAPAEKQPQPTPNLALA